MERKIGETFDFEGKTLQVKESKRVCCDGCFFDGKCYSSRQEVAGHCEAVNRGDNKEVIFVEVREQQQDEQPQEQAEQQTEQPQKLNLCEILKYCPQGETFWSPILGKVEFRGFKDERVKVYASACKYFGYFTASGIFTFGVGMRSEECMLFPSREQRDWSKVDYKPKINMLPKTWEEFCKTHEVQEGEAYIKDISTVYQAENTGDTRDINADKNILPNEMACYQHLALMQLHQLRDCWRDGWKPEPNKTRWGITKDGRGDIELNSFDTVSVFLSFQDEERAELFVKHFRNIIMAAGDLI